MLEQGKFCQIHCGVLWSFLVCVFCFVVKGSFGLNSAIFALV